MARGSTGRRGEPTAPRTVWLTPLERCTSYPTSTSAAVTLWTCSSVAVRSITMTMASILSDIRVSRQPRQPPPAGAGRPPRRGPRHRVDEGAHLGGVLQARGRLHAARDVHGVGPHRAHG